ncbi:MAG: putative signal transduction protein [Polyangiaceae bacterium]|jgi:HD-like signal output (HDOD) protein|nr:putative signal transduction protein [Polyangiaceae bacterium]
MQARSIKPDPESSTLPVAGGTRKQRVLFVDDESAILEGLRAVLRPQRREWDMVFALGGPAGKLEVESSKFDVVVTDMRMPIVDGATLLTRVKELQPQAVRLVLSGQTDPQTALKSVFTAHQFLAKPCDVEKLRSVVKRCCELNELLAAEELKSLAGDVSLLPAAPSTYLSISKVVGDPSSGIQDVARIIEREPTLCAKLLQVANSAFFGLPRAVSSISQAATYLGALALRDLALAMETMATAQNQRALPAASYRAFQLNSLGVALLGRRWYAADRRKADDAFVAGMLRDMGHLVLSTRGERRPGDAAQHAALSAYLLGLWGIPHAVLEAVAYHEDPSRVDHDTLELVDVVHLCDALVGEVSPSPFQAPPVLDEARLATLGVAPTRLREQRAQAVGVLEEARELLGK